MDNLHAAKGDHVLTKVADFDSDFDSYNEAEQTQIIQNEVLSVRVSVSVNPNCSFVVRLG